MSPVVQRRVSFLKWVDSLAILTFPTLTLGPVHTVHTWPVSDGWRAVVRAWILACSVVPLYLVLLPSTIEHLLTMLTECGSAKGGMRRRKWFELLGTIFRDSLKFDVLSVHAGATRRASMEQTGNYGCHHETVGRSMRFHGTLRTRCWAMEALGSASV